MINLELLTLKLAQRGVQKYHHAFQMTASEPPPPPPSLGICDDEESTTSVGKAAAAAGESSKKAKKKSNKKAEKIIKKEKARRHEMIRVRQPLNHGQCDFLMPKLAIVGDAYSQHFMEGYG